MALPTQAVPVAARDAWTALTALLGEITVEHAAWEGQVHRTRLWYDAQLERLYEQADVRRNDLDQLERLSAQSSSRESFVTELTLDPPQASGDLSGDPLLDEDYLVLSTVHSAKGQEWESVHVLNVTDGSFPSEFATGRPESIDEERRLLYVAMTRARSELHLLAPVRFYVTQQAAHGDRYVHGTRSRFLTTELLTPVRAANVARQRRGHGGCAGPDAVTTCRCRRTSARHVVKKERPGSPGPFEASQLGL
jgi:DNA helicase-2/ATP-dependent DNA helicase PcrA